MDAARLPRTRGDGPRPGFPAHAGMDPESADRGFPARQYGTASDGIQASPHTRGWTPQIIRERVDAASPHTRGWRLPRTRGDGPASPHTPGMETVSPHGSRSRNEASPHTRGWTPGTSGAGLRLPRTRGDGFPAHAGMDPHTRGWTRVAPTVASGLPRTRGDGPRLRACRRRADRASPHTRGWTREADVGFPAHAGIHPAVRGLPRTRGDGPRARGWSRRSPSAASPHTRGWTRPRFPAGAGSSEVGFPAHAGMDPSRFRERCYRQRLPRTRGDGPVAIGFPAHAGMDPLYRRIWPAGLPRTRGSARARGFPAHAGMDPLGKRPARRSGWASPHTRGWTLPAADHQYRPQEASPHTRGWTPADVGFPAHAGMDPGRFARGFPAHAGMDPRHRTALPACRQRLPRTRGDGPEPLLALWRGHGGFPAHAGMDPSQSLETQAAPRLPRTRGDGPEPDTAGVWTL